MFPRIFRREAVGGSPLRFRADVSGKSDLVERLERQRTLNGHNGCVNTAVRLCFRVLFAVRVIHLQTATMVYNVTCTICSLHRQCRLPGSGCAIFPTLPH